MRHGFSWFVYSPEDEDGVTADDAFIVMMAVQGGSVAAEYIDGAWVEISPHDKRFSEWLLVMPDLIPAEWRGPLERWIDTNDNMELTG